MQYYALPTAQKAGDRKATTIPTANNILCINKASQNNKFHFKSLKQKI